MSQEKVERYKKEKANRKQNARKQKIMNVIRKSVLGVAAIALVGWLGFSAYQSYTANIPRASVEIDYSAVTDYMNAL